MPLVVRPFHPGDQRDALGLVEDSGLCHMVMIGDGEEIHIVSFGVGCEFRQGQHAVRGGGMGVDISNQKLTLLRQELQRVGDGYPLGGDLIGTNQNLPFAGC